MNTSVDRVFDSFLDCEEKRIAADLSISDTGEFTGMAAVYGNEDYNGDVLDAGACAKSISEAGGEFPLLWQHQRDMPIGVVKAIETARGVKVAGRIAMDTEAGLNAYNLIRPSDGFTRGAVAQLSIGFLALKDRWKSGVRHIVEVQLFEVSLVTIAANPLTNVEQVKAASEMDESVDDSEDSLTTEEHCEAGLLLADMRDEISEIPLRVIRLDVERSGIALARSSRRKRFEMRNA